MSAREQRLELEVLQARAQIRLLEETLMQTAPVCPLCGIHVDGMGHKAPRGAR